MRRGGGPPEALVHMVLVAVGILVALLPLCGRPDVAQAQSFANAAELQQAIDDISGADATIAFDRDFTLDNVVTIPSGKSVTFEGSAVIKVERAGRIIVPSDSSLTWNGPSASGDGTGRVESVIDITGGTFAVKAGSFSGFSFDYALNYRAGNSAVFDVSHGGSLTIDGGTYTDNKKLQAGLGTVIYVDYSGSVTVNGGTFKGNTMDGQRTGYSGGGCVIGLEAGWAHSSGATAGVIECVIHGGTFDGNQALGTPNGGGVVYMTGDSTLGRPHLSIDGGMFTNNYAYMAGGVIYANDFTSLDMENVAIYDNSVRLDGDPVYGLGGGVWLCPGGNLETYVSRGGAIFDNSAVAGDDFVNVGFAGQAGSVTLEQRMLGGGAIAYYQDGGTKRNPMFPNRPLWDIPDTSIPRFDTTNPGNEVVVRGSQDPHVLKSVAADGAKRLAKDTARVVMTGNSAACMGGAIAANGAFVIGDRDAKTTAVKVNKAWDGIAEDAQRSVTVALKLGDYVIDQTELSADNGWKASFDNLPLPETVGDGTMKHSVVELDVDESGYVPSYSDLAWDEAAGAYVVTITNRPVQATPTGIVLRATKTLEGRDLADGEFTFQVKDAKGTVVAEARYAADGSVTFPEITYTEAGEHDYTVVEVAGNAAGVTYDKTVHKVHISVVADAKGKLTAKKSAESDKAIVFTNSYTPPKPEKPEKPDKPDKPEKSKKPESVLPRTGDDSAAPVFVLLALGAGAVMSGVAMSRRRQ